MPDPAEIAQNGGAAVAVLSSAAGFANHAMGWFDHHSTGIFALCSIAGAVVGYLGYLDKKRDRAIRLAHDLRRKDRRTS